MASASSGSKGVTVLLLTRAPGRFKIAVGKALCPNTRMSMGRSGRVGKAQSLVECRFAVESIGDFFGTQRGETELLRGSFVGDGGSEGRASESAGCVDGLTSRGTRGRGE